MPSIAGSMAARYRNNIVVDYSLQLLTRRVSSPTLELFYIEIICNHERFRMRDPGLEEAIRAVGGVSELARRIGISQPSVSNWDRVPAERVLIG